ncbi:hypothetical protein C2845_PM16G13060 [Panicum miliaceum]|uniref:Uncharacterized protein n=1 Tax=Panicum miliaceum TaxID=4540 RepID=A0A3L6PVU8_PANMI|nr:hypothetical protein C2845_PM16G13060 [Panicum miliaceum]
MAPARAEAQLIQLVGPDSIIRKPDGRCFQLDVHSSGFSNQQHPSKHELKTGETWLSLMISAHCPFFRLQQHQQQLLKRDD